LKVRRLLAESATRNACESHGQRQCKSSIVRRILFGSSAGHLLQSCRVQSLNHLWSVFICRGRMHTHIGTQGPLQQQLELTPRATTTTGARYNSSWNSHPELQQPPELHPALNNKGLSHTNSRRSSGYNIHRSRGNNNKPQPSLSVHTQLRTSLIGAIAQQQTTTRSVGTPASNDKQAPARSELQPQTTPRSTGDSASNNYGRNPVTERYQMNTLRKMKLKALSKGE
jgi:hypothetical protein